MADKKIVDLTALASQTGTDLYETSLNGAGSRKETRTQVTAYQQANLDFIHTTGSVTLGDVVIYGADGKNAKSSGTNISVAKDYTGLKSVSVTQDASTSLQLTTLQQVNAGLALKLSLTGGTMSGAINMGSHQINALTDPTLAQDASTKNYVDTGLATKLSLTGGTMSGAINMGSHQINAVTDPTLAQDAATKNYVDTGLALKLNLSGGTMSGAINMGSNLINAVTDPVSAQDAATKNYVDSTVGFSTLALNGCIVSSTANLTATYNNGTGGVGATLTNSGTQAALVLDNGAVSVGQRVLIKDQTSQLQNGIYTVTVVGDGSSNWVLTRSTDFNSNSKVVAGAYTYVQSGTLNNGKPFGIYPSSPITVGTDPIVFANPYAGIAILSATGYLKTQWVDFISSNILKGALPAKYYQTGNATLALVSENIAGSASLITLTVPITSSAAAPYIGEITVTWGNVGGWKIQLNAGDIAYVGNSLTTSGGSISSTDSGDSITLVLVAPQIWVSKSIVGNPSPA